MGTGSTATIKKNSENGVMCNYKNINILVMPFDGQESFKPKDKIKIQLEGIQLKEYEFIAYGVLVV